MVIKQMVFVIAVCLLVSVGVNGQDKNRRVNTSDTEAAVLRHDYPQVAVVAHVRCDMAQAVERIGGRTGYVTYRVSGRVVEPFKGRLRREQKLTYSTMAEASYPAASYRGNKILFLNIVRVKEKWVYSALENSTHQATAKNIAVMREIQTRSVDQRIVPGVRIGRISLGDSQETVRRRIGTPFKRVALSGGVQMDVWRAQKPNSRGTFHTLEATYRRGVVVQIEAANPAYRTDINLFSDLDVGDWVRAYGSQRMIQDGRAQNGSKPKLPAFFNLEEVSYRYEKRTPDTLKYFDWVQRGLALETEGGDYQAIRSVIVHRRGFRVLPNVGGKRTAQAPTVTSESDGDH